MLAEREPPRLLVFCDEDAEVKDPVAALMAARPAAGASPLPLAVLVGPEGGFADRRACRAARGCPTWCGWRSGRASCAPTPPRWRRSRWSAAVLGDWR